MSPSAGWVCSDCTGGEEGTGLTRQPEVGVLCMLSWGYHDDIQIGVYSAAIMQVVVLN